MVGRISVRAETQVSRVYARSPPLPVIARLRRHVRRRDGGLLRRAHGSLHVEYPRERRYPRRRSVFGSDTRRRIPCRDIAGYVRVTPAVSRLVRRRIFPQYRTRGTRRRRGRGKTPVHVTLRRRYAGTRRIEIERLRGGRDRRLPRMFRKGRVGRSRTDRAGRAPRESGQRRKGYAGYPRLRVRPRNEDQPDRAPDPGGLRAVHFLRQDDAHLRVDSVYRRRTSNGGELYLGIIVPHGRRPRGTIDFAKAYAR